MSLINLKTVVDEINSFSNDFGFSPSPNFLLLQPMKKVTQSFFLSKRLIEKFPQLIIYFGQRTNEHWDFLYFCSEMLTTTTTTAAAAAAAFDAEGQTLMDKLDEESLRTIKSFFSTILENVVDVMLCGSAAASATSAESL